MKHPSLSLLMFLTACASTETRMGVWQGQVLDAPVFVEDSKLGSILDISGDNGTAEFRVGDLADNYGGGTLGVSNGNISLNVPLISSNGDILFKSPSRGVILTDELGGLWRLKVSTSGVLGAEEVD